MPVKAKELSALNVKRLKHPGHNHNATFTVGGVDGLQLQNAPTCARSWLLRCMIGQKRRHVGLGGFPDVTLAQPVSEHAKRATLTDQEDAFEERAAIMEYDGGLPRALAEFFLPGAGASQAAVQAHE